MSRSLRTDPYPMRAARRAGGLVPVHACPPRRGFVHAACPADVVAVLAFFGPPAVYGLRGIELRQQPVSCGYPAVAALRVPGLVLLFEQPLPPWVLADPLNHTATARLRRAGAQITTGRAGTRVDWPGDTLRAFMLFDGLMHEVGHHMIQHAAGKEHTRAMRTADHERRADAYALGARQTWAAQV